jgi:hypothetical protein
MRPNDDDELAVEFEIAGAGIRGTPVQEFGFEPTGPAHRQTVDVDSADLFHRKELKPGPLSSPVPFRLCS